MISLADLGVTQNLEGYRPKDLELPLKFTERVTELEMRVGAGDFSIK